MEVTPARLMVGDNLLCQLVAVVGDFSDGVVARVTCSVSDDHPKALWLASYGITSLIQPAQSVNICYP